MHVGCELAACFKAYRQLALSKKTKKNEKAQLFISILGLHGIEGVQQFAKYTETGIFKYLVILYYWII